MSNHESPYKKISKKSARQLVYDRLVVALAEFKTGIKDKRFEANLRKASRLFADDLVKASAKVKDKKKKSAKKKDKVVEATNVPV